jgi:hypothetical protein
MTENAVIMKKNWLFSLRARGKQLITKDFSDRWAAARQGRGSGELRDLWGMLKRRREDRYRYGRGHNQYIYEY